MRQGTPARLGTVVPDSPSRTPRAVADVPLCEVNCLPSPGELRSIRTGVLTALSRSFGREGTDTFTGENDHLHHALTAIDWLCKAPGFERHMVVEHDGLIAHAQLHLGDDMIMVGSVRTDHFVRWTGTVRETEGKNTMSCYLIVDDVAAHHDMAKSVGAEIVS